MWNGGPVMETTYNKRALVGVFDDRLSAEQAVDALHRAGFPHDQVGFAIRGTDAIRGGMIVDTIGTKDGKGAAAGAVTGGMIGGVLAAAVSLLIPGVGPIVAGGVVAAVFGGGVAGTPGGRMPGGVAGAG